MSSTAYGPWRSPAPGRPHVPLPPARMALVRGGRPLKRWRYVGYYGPDVMLCAAVAHIGILRTSWWAVWDREARTLAEHTRQGRACVSFDADGVVRVDDGPVQFELTVEESAGVETVSPHGDEYIWTRKQGGVPIRGTVAVAERTHEVDGFGLVDESAGYHARHTAWAWSAGVGTAVTGARVAWNLVTGVHDDPAASERTVWVDGTPHHIGPVTFSADLSRLAFAEGEAMRFAAEATRAYEENFVLLASTYDQPFGTFRGALPVAGPLREAYGVMERHDVLW